MRIDLSASSSSSSTPARSRHWNATWNNPPADAFSRLKAISGLKYLVAGKEVAPTTGTPHLQIFMTMRSQTSWKTMKNKLTASGLQAVSFRPVTKTPSKAVLYAKKGTSPARAKHRLDGDYQEWGEPPSTQQGKRSDLLALTKAVMDGKSEWEILTNPETAAVSARCHHYMKRLRSLKRQRDHEAVLEQELQQVQLRQWQSDAISSLDKCAGVGRG